MHWDGGWYMGWMWLWWILILAAIVVAVRFLPFGRPPGGGGHESPEQLLKRRYANGEIDKDTYERMLEDLRK